MGDCKKCGKGNVIFETAPQNIEVDDGELTCVLVGNCEQCGAAHYAVVGGTIDLADADVE